MSPPDPCILGCHTQASLGASLSLLCGSHRALVSRLPTAHCRGSDLSLPTISSYCSHEHCQGYPGDLPAGSLEEGVVSSYIQCGSHHGHLIGWKW